MGKLLNLDELVPEQRTLVYKGVEYAVGAIPLREYLAFQKENQDYRKADDDLSRMQFGLRGVRLAIPDFPEAELDGMSMKQITALMEFVGEILTENASPNAKAPAQTVQTPAAETATTTPTEASAQA